MVQETFEILMDQVFHLNPVIDYSMISLDTRWDPKAKRIYNPKAAAQEQSEPVVEERLDPVAGVPLGEGVREDVPECPVGAEVEKKMLLLSIACFLCSEWRVKAKDDLSEKEKRDFSLWNE
ncbi:hypothetical protein PIB30_053404 [Stylosanthes scabra]|uniref:Uncharacterized protein n=1 Tax=Stylosanthes scabra TaxID=79078 RepID=A0ABU6VKH4_9FABA|nr:hypothetical protein [Stylosanthes scabra]